MQLGGAMETKRIAAITMLTACAVTRPAPPKETTRWPDTFAAGTAAAYDIPWARSLDAAADQERMSAATLGRAAKLQAAHEDRDELLFQLSCVRGWTIVMPARRGDCPTVPPSAAAPPSPAR